MLLRGHFVTATVDDADDAARGQRMALVFEEAFTGAFAINI